MRRTEKLHPQVRGEKRLVAIEHRPGGAAHRRVEQRRNESALHDRTFGGWKAVVLGRVPRDFALPRLPGDAPVAERGPQMPSGAHLVHLLAVGETFAWGHVAHGEQESAAYDRGHTLTGVAAGVGGGAAGR